MAFKTAFIKPALIRAVFAPCPRRVKAPPVNSEEYSTRADEAEFIRASLNGCPSSAKPVKSPCSLKRGVPVILSTVPSGILVELDMAALMPAPLAYCPISFRKTERMALSVIILVATVLAAFNTPFSATSSIIEPPPVNGARSPAPRISTMN